MSGERGVAPRQTLLLLHTMTSVTSLVRFVLTTFDSSDPSITVTPPEEHVTAHCKPVVIKARE